MALKMKIKSKVKKTVVTASFCSLFTSCATMIGGSEDKIQLSTNAQGAKVYLNDKYIGDTPLKRSISRDLPDESKLTVKKDGFEDATYVLRKEFNPMATLNLINVVFWGADAMMGNLKKFSDDSIYIEMEPAQTPLKKSIKVIGKNQLKDSKALSNSRVASSIESL
ncbi:PEGA domain-containing protein [Halobacteriovorax sp. GB3]|uniref:PEGA domain-containing protein n=1 Tax=Halobacteriovorax sp. GB3 TaxID=2719615 RepID=UPI002363113A|nr:PEGA domain-containing protein [Halobacteriovorax sp. GB3]MDD0851906.1 PEGA domain-containing protein [Halobacteriovorax sp. GB3]